MGYSIVAAKPCVANAMSGEAKAQRGKDRNSDGAVLLSQGFDLRGTVGALY